MQEQVIVIETSSHEKAKNMSDNTSLKQSVKYSLSGVMNGHRCNAIYSFSQVNTKQQS